MSDRRRPRRPPGVLGIALALLATAALAGCGGGSGAGGEAAAEKAADAEVLNVAIGQETTLVEGLKASLERTRRPQARALLRRLIAQEREHADGLTKAMRGLGAPVEAEAEELDLSAVHGERDALVFAYSLTGSQLTHFLDDVTQLQTGAPQSFAASIAASEAQHLVALRALLGADPVDSVPEAFDTGELPPPPRPPPGRG